MSEEDGLGRLDVGRPRQDRRAVALGETDECRLEVADGPVEAVDRPPQPQPQVGRDLVVAGASRVDLAADRTDPLGECRLEVEVDVLERVVPGERPGRDLGAEALEPGDDRRDLVFVEDARPAETADVGHRCREVVVGEDPIELDRASEVGHPRVVRLAEPTTPHPHADSSLPFGPSYRAAVATGAG